VHGLKRLGKVTLILDIECSEYWREGEHLDPVLSIHVLTTPSCAVTLPASSVPGSL
jgi:hypothetical protein